MQANYHQVPEPLEFVAEGTDAGKKPRRTAVTGQLMELTDRLNILHQRIMELEKRLTPVLQAAYPKEGSTQHLVQGENGDSPLATRLHGLCDMVKRMDTDLAGIASRVDLDESL